MKSFILSDGTEVKMINSTGTLEHIMGNKRVKMMRPRLHRQVG